MNKPHSSPPCKIYNKTDLQGEPTARWCQGSCRALRDQPGSTCFVDVLCWPTLSQNTCWPFEVENTFLSQYDIKSPEGLKLSLLVNKDGVEEMLDFPFVDGTVHLADNWDATFDIVTADDMILPCKCSKDQVRRPKNMCLKKVFKHPKHVYQPTVSFPRNISHQKIS